MICFILGVYLPISYMVVGHLMLSDMKGDSRSEIKSNIMFWIFSPVVLPLVGWVEYVVPVWFNLIKWVDRNTFEPIALYLEKKYATDKQTGSGNTGDNV